LLVIVGSQGQLCRSPDLLSLFYRSTAYLLVSPERGGVCMLIAGELEAANLRRSWFSFQADDDDNDPGDQGPGPYER